MSSIGMPELDSSETKLCRSSLGVQYLGSIPAAATTRRKALRTFAGSSAGSRRKHEIEFLELASALGTLHLGQLAVLRQGVNAPGRQLKCAA